MAEMIEHLITLNEVQHHSETELGRGAYGIVYEAEYNGMICAAKKIHPILMEEVSPEEKEAVINGFLNECEQCSHLEHPNIVKFWGICYPQQDSRIPVMIMEMMDKSLTNYINSSSPSEVTLTQKASILVDIAQGLGYLHSCKPAVVHRDLSPNNVLLKKRMDGSPIAKIADLGVAKLIKADSEKTQSKLTKVPGTVAFMPPEASADKPNYGVSLDVFSFGGIIVFIASHRWPTPTEQVITDSKTGKLFPFTEVERRKEYLDGMAGEMEQLRLIAESCLDNVPSNRPTMESLSVQLRLFKNKVDISKPQLKSFPQPQSTVRNYLSPLDSPWFFGTCEEHVVEGALETFPDGIFLIREFAHRRRAYEICLRWKTETHHIRIFRDKQTNQFYISQKRSFDTVFELVEYYRIHSLVHINSELDTTLLAPYWEHFGCDCISPSKKFTKKEKKSFWRRLFSRRHQSSVSSSTDLNSRSIQQDDYNQSDEPLYEEFKRPEHLSRAREVQSTQANYVDFEIISSAKEKVSKDVPDVTVTQTTESTDSVVEVASCDKTEQQSIPISSPSNHQEYKPYVKIPVEEEPWYFGICGRDEASKHLKEDGEYLVRFSENVKGYVLSCLWDNKQYHFKFKKLKNEDLLLYCTDGPQFTSIREFLVQYVKNQIPVSKRSQVLLKQPVFKDGIIKNYHLCNNTIVHEVNVIHEGLFSNKCIAVLEDSGRCVTVKKCHSNYLVTNCLAEAEILQKCDHPNIIEYIGVCVDSHPTYIIMELMLGGSLLNYLHENESTVTSTQLTAFCTDAADGMKYLTSKGYVHRDLRAASCMVDNFGSNATLKISDFRLTKKTKFEKFTSDEEECRHIMVKWTSPEALQSFEFTEESDVWSYGVLIYEIFSCGTQPYKDMDDAKASELVKEGDYKLTAPAYTPNIIRELMNQCLHYESWNRPSFLRITEDILPVKYFLPVKREITRLQGSSTSSLEKWMMSRSGRGNIYDHAF